MKEDVPPTPAVVPRKRRVLAKVPDLWLAEWLARPDLSLGDKKRVQAERTERRTRARVSRRVVGFVGTGAGMPKLQRQAVSVALRGATEAHHAGATAADGQFHRLCAMQGVPVVVHPWLHKPLVKFAEANYEVSSVEADKDIVRACTELVVAPKEARQPASNEGPVWGMVAYARHRATPVRIIMPDGQVGNGH